MVKQSYEARIKQRLEELHRDIAAKQKELEELQIAAKVIERLGVDDGAQPDEKSKLGTPSLTIPGQIVDFLQRYGPMESQALLLKLQAEWRKDLGFPTLSSTLSRMKTARLVRNNGRMWEAVDEDEPDLPPPARAGLQ